MSVILSESFDSTALWSTVTYFLSGFFILLVAFLAIIAFSVMVSLTIVSAVHIFSEALLRQQQQEPADVEAARGHEVEVQGSQQVLEALNRIIREQGRAAAAAEEERLRDALGRLPPGVKHGGGGGEKGCVICLEEFEAEDMCQAFPACRHVFHSDCIGSWLKTNSTCPLCRTCILDQCSVKK